MLLNLGDGQFLDITEGVGLLFAGDDVGNARLTDADNDGDLDLLISWPGLLYLNDGTGLFTDQTARSGIPTMSFGPLMGDYNLDGFLDVFFGHDEGRFVGGDFGGLFRHRGNDNHWLRIELVGTQSNRNGINARLTAWAGELHQMRELTSGDGSQQDELVVHFGLGERILIDSLEVRWPSGQIDRFTDLSADQKIRIIEGRGEYFPVRPTVWAVPPPKQLVAGVLNTLEVIVRPALFEPSSTISSITADLSPLGGDADLPLEDSGDGTFRLMTDFTAVATDTLADIAVVIEEQTSLGPHWIRLSRRVEITNNPNTVVQESRTDIQPTAFTLAQNYPNPFNSSTVIRFTLPEKQDVHLVVYNLTGQQVATLVAGARDAGTYTVRWDGRDDLNRELASGLYLYRLKAGPREKTRKLLLVR